LVFIISRLCFIACSQRLLNYLVFIISRLCFIAQIIQQSLRTSNKTKSRDCKNQIIQQSLRTSNKTKSRDCKKPNNLFFVANCDQICTLSIICMSFFDLWIPIILLVSSNSSWIIVVCRANKWQRWSNLHLEYACVQSAYISLSCDLMIYIIGY
jgi:hypothetical protein